MINKSLTKMMWFYLRISSIRTNRPDISTMNNCIGHSVKRIADFTREETIDFRNQNKKYINLYNLIIQIAPIVDTDLHRLSIYLRFLLKKIEVESIGGIDITDKVLLQYYKLEKKTDGSIELNDGKDSPYVGIAVSGEAKTTEPETDLLSYIIDTLNQKYGTNFAESEKVAIEQISTNLRKNKDLELKGKVNSYEVFKHAFEPSFLEGVIQEYDKNQEFYGRILKDDDFKSKLMDLIMLGVYSSFKEAN